MVKSPWLMAKFPFFFVGKSTVGRHRQKAADPDPRRGPSARAAAWRRRSELPRGSAKGPPRLEGTNRWLQYVAVFPYINVVILNIMMR